MARLINNKEQTLEDALKNSLPQAESIDILTGYFYFSGFSVLAEEINDKHIRILVGRSIDPNVINILSTASKAKPDINLDSFQDKNWYSYNRTKKREMYTESFIQLFNKSALSGTFDSTDSQKMQLIFEKKLRNGTLEIRMTDEDNHAKFYVLKNKPEFSAGGDSKGIIFMGSSNFTYSGLLGQGELNQRFSDNRDYEDYRKEFDRLWNDSNTIDIQTSDSNNSFIEEIEQRLWIHSRPSPYKVFIRILHELYKETDKKDIKTPNTISGGKFSNLRYQLDAVRDAVNCIKENNGVIIADVVGLGKSIIASTVAVNLDISRTFIITPPHLLQQWKDYVSDFGIRGAIVESGGKLEELHARYSKLNQSALFIIDEAHRYRNELTNDYQYLHQLTRSNAENKVILLTATPYNNKPQDLFAMIKLFQTPSRSTIHSVDNLSYRFRELIVKYNKLERAGKKKMTDKVRDELKKLSEDLRLLIDPVIIRRSRIDLKEIKEYANDLESQNISFPRVIGPELIEYDLGEIRELYVNTLLKLTQPQEGFIGARYMAATYVVDKEIFTVKYSKFFDDHDIQTAQRNLAQIMRRLLVTRFESSKFSFASTLRKMIKSQKTIIKWWNVGYVPVLKRGELPDPTDIELDSLIEEVEKAETEQVDIEAIKKIAIPVPKEMFKEQFIMDVKHDVDLLENIYNDWFVRDEIGFDPKIDCVEQKVSSLLKEDINRKIVIFSSFADTAEWVSKNLAQRGYRAMLYTGSSSSKKRKIVSQNFDASLEKEEQKNDYDIIVATDALSEGFNLHRAGIIINYDIPYNPTRVVQRIGRINRINKRVFDKIYIFNFFPTDVGASITNIRNISTLKMLLINSIIGSDTKTLTPYEDLQSFFKNQYLEADSENNEKSWDNEYRNIYSSIKHNRILLDDCLSIPERTRIVRKNRDINVSISFAKRGNGTLFALAEENEKNAKIVSPEQVLKLFKAEKNEKSFEGDAILDEKFEILRKKITEPHPLPKVSGNRAEALRIVDYLSQNYRPEKDYLLDLYEVIKTFDDLSDGELKFISQLTLDEDNLEPTVQILIERFSSHYIGVIKERAESIDKVTEVIMFTEDLRK